MIYLISYDLNKPVQDYEGLIDDIKNLGDWAHMLKSAWLVDCELSVQQIYDKMMKHIDPTDALMVNELTKNQRGFLNTEVVDWLNSHF